MGVVKLCGCGLCVRIHYKSVLLCVCVCACLLVLTGGVAHLGNLISVSIVVASQWVWLNSVGVVCMSVSITKALDALLCVCVCMLVLTGGVAHLGNLISVSIVLASQWVWLDCGCGLCVHMLYESA